MTVFPPVQRQGVAHGRKPAEAVRAAAGALNQAHTAGPHASRRLAAANYWAAWADALSATVPRCDSRARALLTVGQRGSAVSGTPRRATKPANALLKVECVIALRSLGLDPVWVCSTPTCRHVIHLVSEFHDDFTHWEEFRFFDRGVRLVPGEQPSEYYITIAGETLGNLVRAQSLAEVLEDYRTHEEAKSLGPDGGRCTRQTAGLLQRRPVRVRRIHQIGKEANELEDVASGLISDPDDVLSTYEEIAIDYEPR